MRWNLKNCIETFHTELSHIYVVNKNFSEVFITIQGFSEGLYENGERKISFELYANNLQAVKELNYNKTLISKITLLNLPRRKYFSIASEIKKRSSKLLWRMLDSTQLNDKSMIEKSCNRFTELYYGCKKNILVETDDVGEIAKINFKKLTSLNDLIKKKR